MNNITGCTKQPEEIIEENKVDFCVCLTEWHKQQYQKLYPSLKFKVINNGIELKETPRKSKIPDTFLYTSGSIRGLDRLLELWPQIVSMKPKAHLFISSYEEFPKNDFDKGLLEIINLYTSITHLGKLNKQELNSLMEQGEYWLYPCSFDETSCITAMEMLYNEVICLYYPRAGLTDTMNGHGIVISPGNEIDSLCLSEEQKLKLKQNGKEYAESCSWKNRCTQWLDIIQTKVFYRRPHFAEELLTEYVSSLHTKYDIKYTIDLETISSIDEIVFVHEIFDDTVFEKNVVSYLNTEPLSLNCRLNYVLEVYTYYPRIKTFYDYSYANIKIMNDHGIKNTVHLPYLLNPDENKILKQIKSETDVVYDFGIISSSTVWTTDPEQLTPPRRKELVKHLISKGYKVNVITGFDEKRDREIAKCKRLLNIHGQYMNEPCKIFEHIRCNRLLYAGYNILSETSNELEPEFYEQFPNVEFKTYEEIWNV
jgi:hypothetical protein